MNENWWEHQYPAYYPGAPMADWVGPIPLDELTHNEINYLHAAGTVGGFDPRRLVSADFYEASRALGSGVYRGAGDGSLKKLSWQEFLATKVSQEVKDYARQAVQHWQPGRLAMFDAFMAYNGSYQSQRSLMV